MNARPDPNFQRAGSSRPRRLFKSQMGGRCDRRRPACDKGIARICNAAKYPHRVVSTASISVIQWTNNPRAMRQPGRGGLGRTASKRRSMGGRISRSA